eukprot:IDg22573t1
MCEVDADHLSTSLFDPKVYSRLMFLANLCKAQGDYNDTLFGAARCVLKRYPVTSTTCTGLTLLPGPVVLDHLRQLLLDADGAFTDDYFQKPVYALRVLFDIAVFYDAVQVEHEFISQLQLSTDDGAREDVQRQIWLAHLLGLDINSTRTVVERYTDVRPRSTRRVSRRS